jgi:hypothetical protein
LPALTLPAGAFLVLASAVYGFTTLSASVPRWLVIYIWASFALLVAIFHLWKDGIRKLDEVDLAALCFLSWAAFSLAWSGDKNQGIVQLSQCAALCCVFMWSRRFPEWIPEAAFLALWAGMILQWLFPWDWGGHGNRNFQTEAMVLAWLVAWQSTRLAWLVALIVSTPVFAYYLLVENPSKIEYIAVPAALMWIAYDRRDVLKLLPRPY